MKDAHWKLFWSQDTSVACFEGSHAVLFGLFAVPMALIVLVGFPVITAACLILFRKRNALESIEIKEMFGFLYQAYKKEYVFWDSFIFLRKAALALVSIFGTSLGTNLQGLIATCILNLCVGLQIILQPYNDLFGDLNRNESFSLIVSLLIFIWGLFLDDSNMTNGGRIFLSIVVIVCISSFVVYFIGDIYVHALKLFRLELELNDVPLKEQEIHFILAARWICYQFAKFFKICWRGKNPTTTTPK